jgi:hypothetical protein
MPIYPDSTNVSIPSAGEGKTPFDRAELRRLVVNDHDQHVKPHATARIQIIIRKTRSNLDELTIVTSFC